MLTNSDIAELLAREAESAKMPAKKALRRASRRALFWPEEAAVLLRQRRSLTELTAVGPYLASLIKRWIEDPPSVSEPPPVPMSRADAPVPGERCASTKDRNS